MTSRISKRMDTKLTPMIKRIESSRRVLIMCPQKASVDALAATIALKQLLQTETRHIKALLPAEVPYNLHFLLEGTDICHSLDGEGAFCISLRTDTTKVDHIKYVTRDDAVDILVSSRDGFFTPADVSFPHKKPDFDLVITVGGRIKSDFSAVLSDFDRSQIMAFGIQTAASWASESFADATASSLSEMVWESFTSVSSDVATLLLAGVIAETESFLGQKTSAKSFFAASQLQNAGGDQSLVIENLFKKKRFPTLKIWGRIFGNVEIDEAGFAWSKASKADFELAETSPQAVGNVASEILQYVRGARVFILFLEEEDRIVVQLRSRSEGLPWKDLLSHVESTDVQEVAYGYDIVFCDAKPLRVENTILDAVTQFCMDQGYADFSEMKRVEQSFDLKIQPKAPDNPPFELE